jgi:hypothetical protein
MRSFSLARQTLAGDEAVSSPDLHDLNEITPGG